MAEVVELQKLKLAELKQECAARGLSVKGNKAELIGRLQLYLEEHGEEHEEDVNEEEVLGEEAEELAKAEAADANPLAPKSTAVQTGALEGATEKKVVKISPPVSLGEKLQKRAERFSVEPSADSKKAMRAARFGLPVVAPVNSQGNAVISQAAVSVDVLKKRAERFGMNVSSISKKVEEDEKLKKRKARFGSPADTAAAGGGGGDVEEKKRKRAERFGNV